MKKAIFVFLIIVLYLFLRLNWIGNVDFGYDQPHHGLIIQDFIRNGNLINIQQFSQITHWHYYSWGPAFNLFFTPLFLISSNPLILSMMLGVLNLVSVILVIVIGWRYFSPKVGIVAGLLFATYPWWSLFSRLIYQPNPPVLFTTISMLLTLLVIKKRQKIYIALVIFSWAVLMQLYLVTFAFVITSFVFLLFKFSKFSKKHILLGFFASFILFLPSIYFYFNNKDMFIRFFTTPSRFTPPETTYIERISNVIKAYFTISAGGMFESVLGYGFEDFSSFFYLYRFGVLIIGTLMVIVVVYGVLAVFKYKKERILRALLLFWAIAPLWFLSTLWVSQLIPRYFLNSIPALVILISLFFNDLENYLRKKFKMYSNLVWVIPIAISFYWGISFIKYNQFLESYHFPEGKLVDVAEAPYIYLEKAVGWVIEDSENKGYQQVILSNDVNCGRDYCLWFSTKYLWEYVFNKDYIIEKGKPTGRYLMVHSDYIKRNKVDNYQQFGPFVVFEDSFKNLPN